MKSKIDNSIIIVGDLNTQLLMMGRTTTYPEDLKKIEYQENTINQLVLT